jgi:hypothetical protein
MLAWFLARLRAFLIPPQPALARIRRSSDAASRRPLRRRTIEL